MKRNGMCPLCYAKTILIKRAKKNQPTIYNNVPYNNAMSLTPPMGWSSWNTFAEHIDQDLLYDMAKLMREKGLVDAGYIYLNIDDCWEAKERNYKGELETDYHTFSRGMEDLVKKVNGEGMKLGIYSSNGLLTCQDFPASLGYEYTDAYTFAKWGVEYWKLDFCHHVDYTKYAPMVAAISVAKKDGKVELIGCEKGKTSGTAHIFRSRMPKQCNEHKLPKHVTGLDAGLGAIEFEVNVPEAGEYVLSVYTHEVYKFEKFLGAQVNGGKLYTMKIPKNIRWYEYTTQKMITLEAGKNVIKLFNPIDTHATSDMLQYQYAGECIKKATKQYSEDSGKEEKKIVFSLCEWGSGSPYKWGASAGNLWRTTGDISANWGSITKLYEFNVKLHEYAGVGAWNDPDMLEVGNGKLTYIENEAHFALWCMMAAPLILGNDIRKMKDDILALVTNKTLIAINQDALGKQAKRIVKSNVDILVKPLADGRTAVCAFNKSQNELQYNIDINMLKSESYISFKDNGEATDALSGATVKTADILSGKIASHAVKVYII